MNLAPVIGDAGIERVRRMGKRQWSVTVPEVMEEFDTIYRTAHRFVQRMVRDGVLKRTDQRRRRTEVFEKSHGAGGIVYRATRREANEDAVEFFDSRWKRRQRRTRRR